MKRSPGGVVIVLVTTANRREAMRIAEAVVGRRLAACGNVIPSVTSVFRWKGRINKSREAFLVMKTHADRYAALEKVVRSMHSYEVPEIIGVSVTAGLQPYLEWVHKETATD